MAHGITEIDKGIVFGTTWHGLTQYIQQDVPVSYEQALEILDYPIEKRQLLRLNANGETVPTEAWEIIRTDYDEVLAPMVGSRFHIDSNTDILEHVNENFIKQFDHLQIESVGTLFAGAVSFVNIKLDEHQVKGDESKTLSRLMYYNPIGRGAYKTCAHTIRIVCNNTLNIAENIGRQNGSLLSIRHTGSASARIADHMSQIAEIQMGLQKHQEKMNFLAAKELAAKDVSTFFDMTFKLPSNASKSAVTRFETRRDGIIKIFEGDQHLKGTTKRSAYALLQATTDYFDHSMPRLDADNATVQWNGIVGNTAETKQLAMSTLLKLVA